MRRDTIQNHVRCKKQTLGLDDSTHTTIHSTEIRLRRAAKIDENHNEIVEALRLAGCSVLSLAAIGKGVPDILVGRLGEQYLLEIKTAKGKLTPDQIIFIDKWRGEVHVVRTPEEALIAVGVRK